MEWWNNFCQNLHNMGKMVFPYTETHLDTGLTVIKIHDDKIKQGKNKQMNFKYYFKRNSKSI